MQTVRMHVDGNGIIWLLAKCRVCGDVHKYLGSDAIVGPVRCKSCGRPMDMQGATIERARELGR